MGILILILLSVIVIGYIFAKDDTELANQQVKEPAEVDSPSHGRSFFGFLLNNKTSSRFDDRSRSPSLNPMSTRNRLRNNAMAEASSSILSCHNSIHHF